jgi:prolyl oligopeptidase
MSVQNLPIEATEIATEDIVIDTYHGIEIADPFRWLEDHQSPRTRTWIEEQAARSRSYLEALPGRERLGKRIAELIDRETIGEIVKSGDTIFYTKRNPGEEQARIYRRVGIQGQDELLLDPATMGEGSGLSLTVVAYGLRTGGQGARRVRILNLETGETLPDELPKSALRGFAFLPNSNGFLHVTEEVGKPDNPKAAKRHFFGKPFNQDKTVFYGGRAANMRLVSSFDPESWVAIHTVIRAVKGENLISVHLQMLNKCGNPLFTLVEDSRDPWDVCIHGDQLYLFLDRHNGKGRTLQRIPLSAPDVEQAGTVLTEETQRIQSWRIFGGYLLTVTVENLTSVLRLYSLTGEALGTIDLPKAGTASILTGDENGCFFSFESYAHPREVYYYDCASKTRVLFSSPSEEVPNISVRRIEYPAEDGTQIPLTLLGKPEVLEHGNAPALLTAYGAAGVCLTPQYSFLATYFVELGGVFAIAHVRGGGEKGLAWEEAGKRRKRPNVHKDFLAAAEFLGTSGIANRNRIAIAGGSNSGLLVGTAMTQRPDLFRAVLCLAPILDMLRYHRFDNTQFYIPQFGSADDPEDFPVLLSYSPYHNIHEGVCYPALLMTSGDADTRCDPMHARKFVARLQAAMSGLPEKNRREHPILLDWNPLRGHFATLSLATRTAAIVDRLVFLCHHLHMEVA